MGITRPSLYAAFGNKEALFRKALDLYERDKLAYVGKALAEPTARKVAEAMLRGAVDNMTGHGDPHGCLGVIATVSCGAEAQSIREEVLERGKVARQALVDRLERAKAEGDLPAARRCRRADQLHVCRGPGHVGPGRRRRDPGGAASAPPTPVLMMWPID